jgi:intracellular multiplication protein IcmC
MRISGKLKIIPILLALLSLFPVSAYAITTDFTQWLYNLQTNLPGVLQLIIASSYVTGVVFFAQGILKLKAYGHQTVFMSTHANFTGPLVYMIVGIILVFFPTMIDTGIYTLWGYSVYDTSNMIAYPADENLDLSGMLEPVIAIVRITGYISFFRGFLLLSRFGHQGAQQGTFSKALIHMIGGLLAVNIVGTWYIIENTLLHAANI